MRIYVATDHAGYDLKESLVPYIKSLGHEVIDMGAHSLDPQDDYPDFIIPAAREVAKNPNSRGVILGGSGQGEALSANKVKGIRAALYYGGDRKIVTLSREHGDANILSLGARFLSEDEAKSVVKEWLDTRFSEDERHIRRLKKIEDLSSAS